MVERRIKEARFPTVKSLDSFDFTTIPSLNKTLVLELARCEYIARRENVIAVGNSGTGKTHISLGLGLAAQKGLSVGFTTAAALVHELIEARDDKRLLRLQRQLAAYKLLIIDELGYVPLSTTGAELLFEVFSQRYEHGSTIVTSNLPFDEWTGVFGSERLTGALLDRLTHHVHILEMNGDSYRLDLAGDRTVGEVAARRQGHHRRAGILAVLLFEGRLKLTQFIAVHHRPLVLNHQLLPCPLRTRRRALCEQRQPCRTYGRTASSSVADGARRGPSPSSTGGTIVTPQLGSVFSDAWACGWFSSGAFKDGPTMTGVPRPTASATTDSAKLSAMPCASLFSELKLHGANSTTPRGGRGRIARSKYDWTTCAPSTSASSRGAITREAFGVGSAMTVAKPSPTRPRRISGQRADVVVPLSTR